MTNTPKYVWSALSKYYTEELKPKDKDIVFHEEKKEEFISYFTDKYNAIRDEYMNENVSNLDRHKQAAILIADIIENHLFELPNLPEDEIFIGSEQTALLIGLTYMKSSLNKELATHNLPEINEYVMPEAISCKTPYFDILTRDLYFQSHKDSHIYILNLSNILFLIEYITLKELGIDMDLLKNN